MLSIAALAIVIGIGYVAMSWSYKNKEERLRTRAIAQDGKIETTYDAMWKILQQDASVTDEYKSAFKEIYTDLISGRYDNDGDMLMKWIKEDNPTFDTSLYQELMRKIDVERNKFKNEQDIMLDIIREHTNLLINRPSKWFVGDRPQIEYVVISSTVSKKVMETRLDDDVELFKRDNKPR